MAIVSGVNIPDNKRVEISLLSVFGIGLTQAKDVVDRAAVDGNPHVKDLTETELARIREIIDREKTVEGDLRRETAMNIKRLMDLGSYRGLRHRRKLPVRGQRTHTNARTRKGPAKPIAGKKK